MSRSTDSVERFRVPMLPNPPALEAAAANSADVAEPIGARMIGYSMPRRSQSDVLIMELPHGCRLSYASGSEDLLCRIGSQPCRELLGHIRRLARCRRIVARYVLDFVRQRSGELDGAALV